uniref:C1q domain-containing protein n=1 Tax=Magallana gigas TaxID=29159 RepID=A0A8W8LPU8_MAGGI
MFRCLCTIYGLVVLASREVEGFGLKCLRCDDVLEPRFCERIEYCQDGDVCGVQRYRKENGDLSFWSGCLPHSNCAKVTNRTILTTNSRRAVHGSVLCQECCNGDLCNSEGCGAPGLPTSRGPMCFNCAHTLNPSDCHHVTVCGANELCFLGEKPIFGQRYFTSHCEDVHACENHASAPIIFGRKRLLRGQRSYTPCSGCCHGDLCNINCNATFTPNTVVNSGSTAAPSGTSVPERPGNYAFYAQLTLMAQTGHVIFKNVTTNEGSAYSGTTGIFTCKYSGAHAFSWTIATSSQRYTNADLVVNDVAIGSSFTDSRGSSVAADSSTGFVVFNLKVGDKVRVNINGTADALYSTFSGWRLQQNNASFYAKALSSLDKPSSASHGFEFQSVVNNGNVYDSTNGVFTCPETGLYALAFAVETSGLDFMVYFYRGGSKLNEIGVWPDSSNGLLQDTSSTLQIFLLTRGDQIYLYPSESDARIKPFHSTFSGWRIENPTSNTPAFVEYISSSTSTTPIRFNREALDITSSFSISSFQAPKDGVYLFFWNMEVSSRHLRTFLEVNDSIVGRTVSDGHTAGYDSGSNLAILRLRRNDNVRVAQDYTADGDQTMISGYFMFS